MRTGKLQENQRPRLRRAVASLSPGHRRWVQFLRALPLDPDRLDRPVREPGDTDFVICGSPRTGTTLLCAALFQPPSVVTVMEPWDGMRLAPADLFTSLRREIDGTGSLVRGRLDVAALRQDGTARWSREGDRPVAVATGANYLLGVKWPAYWRYLDVLTHTKFLVCLRHPFETIASYKKTGGRVGLGLDYDTAFNRPVNEALGRATRNPAIRRVLLFDHIHERMIPHLGRPNVLVVRYERWFEDPDNLLGEIGDFLGAEVSTAPVRIRPPESRAILCEQEAELVRTYCRTAEQLGYPLDKWPRVGARP